jgi:hypothetical protein
MILVLLTALALGVGIPLSRLNPRDIHDLKPRLFLLGAFVLLVAAKLGLLIGLRAKRYQADNRVAPESIPSSGHETPYS